MYVVYWRYVVYYTNLITCNWMASRISTLGTSTKNDLSFQFLAVGLVPMIGFCAPTPWRILSLLWRFEETCLRCWEWLNLVDTKAGMIREGSVSIETFPWSRYFGVLLNPSESPWSFRQQVSAQLRNKQNPEHHNKGDCFTKENVSFVAEIVIAEICSGCFLSRPYQFAIYFVK